MKKKLEEAVDILKDDEAELSQLCDSLRILRNDFGNAEASPALVANFLINSQSVLRLGELLKHIAVDPVIADHQVTCLFDINASERRRLVSLLCQLLANFCAAGDAAKRYAFQCGESNQQLGLFSHAAAAAVKHGSRKTIATCIHSLHNCIVVSHGDVESMAGSSSATAEDRMNQLCSCRSLLSQLLLAVENRSDAVPEADTTQDPVAEWWHILMLTFFKRSKLSCIWRCLQHSACDAFLYEYREQLTTAEPHDPKAVLAATVVTSERVEGVDGNNVIGSAVAITREQLVFLRILLNVIEDEVCLRDLLSMNRLSFSTISTSACAGACGNGITASIRSSDAGADAFLLCWSILMMLGRMNFDRLLECPHNDTAPQDGSDRKQGSRAAEDIDAHLAEVDAALQSATTVSFALAAMQLVATVLAEAPMDGSVVQLDTNAAPIKQRIRTQLADDTNVIAKCVDFLRDKDVGRRIRQEKAVVTAAEATTTDAMPTHHIDSNNTEIKGPSYDAVPGSIQQLKNEFIKTTLQMLGNFMHGCASAQVMPLFYLYK